MMFSLPATTSLLALAIVGTNAVRRPIADLLLSTPGTTCDIRAAEPQALLLRFYDGFQSGNCYNLDAVYSSGNDSCVPSDICPTDFLAAASENYDAAANYSWTSFEVYDSRSPAQPDLDLGNLTVRAFEGEGCMANEDIPFFEWGSCNSTELKCSELPFRIGSFSVLQTPLENRTAECLIAAVRGAGVRSTEVRGITAVAVAVMLASM